MIWKIYSPVGSSTRLGVADSKPTEGVSCGQKFYKSGQTITNNYFQILKLNAYGLISNSILMIHFKFNDSFQISNY